MKRTLSKHITKKGNIKAEFVKEFISDLIRDVPDCVNEFQVINLIKDKAGKELLNSPHVSSRLKGKPVTSEDTIKGCGKEFVIFCKDYKYVSFCKKGQLCDKCKDNKEPEWMWDRYNREKNKK